MIDLDSVKLAFFDLDGVLSVPRYRDKQGHINCGYTSDNWFAVCNTYFDVYNDCVAPMQVKNLLKSLKDKGVELYVLTHETSSGSYFNKVDFVLRNYGEYFKSYRQVLFISRSKDKIKLMNIKACNAQVLSSETLLVEDTFDTCLTANDCGYQVMHISELLLGGD